MAEPGRTVRVSGLPADMEDERLIDKLFIHFLRSSNGGGEIDSVVIVKATPVYALVTFEDSRVAQRVLHPGRHLLEVDGKKFRLSVTEHRERPGPDQIILTLSATIDYSLLPGGISALKTLCTAHPDVHMYFTSTEECCTLSGAYTEVQAVLAQLLEHPGGSEPAEIRESSGPASNGGRPVQTAQESDDQRRKPVKQKEKKHTDKPLDGHNPGSIRDLTPGGYGWEDPGPTDGAAALQPPSTPLEDFTLILDADMFQYLQKRCQKEYRKILSQLDVEAVDVTNEGLTTLFLQVGAAARGSGHAQECLKLARKAIGRLYQENEAKVRRAQLPKTILSSEGEVKRALESLSVSHPELLLSEDEQNVYIVGGHRDVSEAKQFFLLDHGKTRGKEEDGAADFRLAAHASGPPTNSDERISEILKSEEDERRPEGGSRRFKLAPQFKDAGVGALGPRLTDYTSRASSSPGVAARRGPMLGRDVLSDTARLPGESVSRAEAQNTGADILFNAGHALPAFASMPSKAFLKPEVTDTRPKTLKPPVSTAQSSLPGSTTTPTTPTTTPLLPAASGSTLKRANSFSGTLRKKAQADGPTSQDDSSKVRTRGRSSSFNAKASREKQEVHTAELRVSPVLWSHVLKAYKTRVEDLTSDVQMKEKTSADSLDLTLTLKGANSSKVTSCLLGLQELLDSVNSDFSVQELFLSELGVTDTKDETLEACCAEVRSRFKKVTIQPIKDSLFLQGPSELCSQISASIREVFSGAARYPSSLPPISMSSLRMNELQSTNLQLNGGFSLMLESETVNSDGNNKGREWETTYRSDFVDVVNGSTDQPLKRKELVMKEKVRTADGRTAEGSVSLSAAGRDASTGRVNGVGSPTTRTEAEVIQEDGGGREEEKTEIPSTGSRSGREASVLQCLCGAEGAVKTKCGVTVCSKCADAVHSDCRVCHKMEQKPPGIHGKMSLSKLAISLPGHARDCAIKITYRIPDGIQGDDHPSPGQPFRGGDFEAFLPECEKTKRLLPRLEQAFRLGLTFTVAGWGTDAKVTWDGVPHKTSLQGGKSGNGYPDSSFLTRLSEVLTALGIR